MKIKNSLSLIGIFSILAIMGFSLTINVEEASSLRDSDRDFDGIVDELDMCPHAAENYNKYEDGDGCPDTVIEEKTKYEFPDTDGDGIDDRKDQCIDLPETFNGYTDWDGCPEDYSTKSDTIDSDSDSIPDSIDLCPTQKETINEFQDGDGCPDALKESFSNKGQYIDDECTGEKIAVMRVHTKDIVCLSLDTAERWEGYGLGEIMTKSEPADGGLVVSTDEMMKELAPEIPPKETSKKLFESTMTYTEMGPEIDPEKGYAVIEIGDGLFWITDGMYQLMFLTTGEGVVVVDAPMGMGEKILQAIEETTSEPITHVIYTHIHKDHIGSASIFPEDTVYISHIDTAEHLKMKNDPQRPIPAITFQDEYILNVGDQTLELSYLGAFHSKGDIVVNSPEHKVIMAVDLFHPDAAPFMYFGIARDMGEHIAVHDKLLEMDWDIVISGHEPILGTPEHLAFNKEFTLGVLDNAITAMQTTQPSENYFKDLANTCAELTLEQYPDLKDIEVYPVENCVTMVFYAMID